jgi:muramoyltetrapeptide carboxypeptidase
MPRSFKPLEPGEPIGVVALSGPVESSRLEKGLATLRGWGNPVVEAPNLRATAGYLAGSDSERLAGLEWLLDQDVRIIVAARGGYGATRLFARLPWRRMAETGTSLVGFSDMTALLTPLHCAGGAVQIHGPMVAAGLDSPHNAERLRAVLQAELVGHSLFRYPARSVVAAGRVTGRSVGGNLSIITTLLGTPHQPLLDGCVLFLEEVGEPLYRLDRMLTHLATSGTLRRVKALMSGSLRGCRPATGRAEKWRELLEEVAPRGAVVVVDLPFGHGVKNLAFPIGAAVEVDTSSGTVTWSG